MGKKEKEKQRFKGGEERGHFLKHGKTVKRRNERANEDDERTTAKKKEGESERDAGRKSWRRIVKRERKREGGEIEISGHAHSTCQRVVARAILTASSPVATLVVTHVVPLHPSSRSFLVHPQPHPIFLSLSLSPFLACPPGPTSASRRRFSSPSPVGIPSRVPLSRVPRPRRDRDARESIARGLRQGEQPTFLHTYTLSFSSPASSSARLIFRIFAKSSPSRPAKRTLANELFFFLLFLCELFLVAISHVHRRLTKSQGELRGKRREVESRFRLFRSLGVCFRAMNREWMSA